jgi:pimeloyl-ACP methyl ester carboxylesterase
MMQGMTPETGSVALAGAGVPEADAREMASHIDDTMKDCILKLYRSAVDVGKEWYADIVANIPRGGLLIWGADDPYMQVKFAEMMAKDIGARVEVLPETGHWWPVQRPAEIAQLLEGHWAEASSK